MKKTKAQQTVAPVSLNSKRHSFNQDRLLAPYKIDWSSSFQPADGPNSKGFFTQMKAELSNIKNDFEKLMQKDEKASSAAKTKEHIQPRTVWNTEEKGKSYSSNRKDEKQTPGFKRDDKIQQMLREKQGLETHPIKGFNLTKNINEAVNFKNKHIPSKYSEQSSSGNTMYLNNQPQNMIEPKLEQFWSTTPKKQVISHQQIVRQKVNSQQKLQLQRQRQYIGKLQHQISIYRRDNQQNNKEKQRLSEQNGFLKNQNRQLNDRNNNYANQIRQNQSKYSRFAQQMQEMKNSVQNKEQFFMVQGQLHRLQQILNYQREQFGKESFFLNEKVNEVTFYNNNLFYQNKCLVAQNLQIKQFITHLQKNIEDLKKQINDNQRESQRKIDYQQKTINQYEKRQRMLQLQIERLFNELRSAQSKNNQSQTSDNSQRDQISFLQNQITRLQQINKLLANKSKQYAETSNFQNVIRSFQKQIEQLSNENYNLKKKVNSITSKMEQIQEQNRSYLNEISIYQQRDKVIAQSKSLQSNQWQQLTNKIELLQVENAQLRIKSQYKQLLSEVLAQKDQSNVTICVNNETQNLVQKLYQSMQQIIDLRKQISDIHDQADKKQMELQHLRMNNCRLKNQISCLLDVNRQPQKSRFLQQNHNLTLQLQDKQSKIKTLKIFLLKVLKNKLQSFQQSESYNRLIGLLQK